MKNAGSSCWIAALASRVSAVGENARQIHVVSGCLECHPVGIHGAANLHSAMAVLLPVRLHVVMDATRIHSFCVAKQEPIQPVGSGVGGHLAAVAQLRQYSEHAQFALPV